ncbi:MAG: cytochrome c maturation protein CcmE [Asticcacaulis sp.]
MGWLPKSPKARRRLYIVAAVAPVLAGAVALSLYAMQDAVVYFYSPAQAAAEKVAVGRTVRLGGLVEAGSVQRITHEQVRFRITDQTKTVTVTYKGDLPDLFREGQGVVTQGQFQADGTFKAKDVLAKHDETYMPREVAEAIKAQGEWRGDGAGAPKGKAYGKSDL